MHLTISLLLASASLAGDPPPESLRRAATGRFLLAESPTHYKPRLDTTVEKAIASLHWALRPLARLRLRPAVYETVCHDISFVVTEELFTVRCAGQEPFSRRLDRPPEPLLDEEDDGEPYQVRLDLEEDAITVTFDGPKGGQRNRYRFPGDGSLQLSGTIFSKSLPEPVVWQLPYKRAD